MCATSLVPSFTKTGNEASVQPQNETVWMHANFTVASCVGVVSGTTIPHSLFKLTTQDPGVAKQRRQFLTFLMVDPSDDSVALNRRSSVNERGDWSRSRGQVKHQLVVQRLGINR